MLSCNEAMTLLSNFLSNRLPPEQAHEVYAHLRSCKGCPHVQNICGTWVLEERASRKHAARKPAQTAA